MASVWPCRAEPKERSTLNLLFEFYLAKASAGYFIEELFNLVVFCDFANARLFMWRRQGHLEQAGGKRMSFHPLEVDLRLVASFWGPDPPSHWGEQ